ncbi:SDR family NAD(P)-dependent oxidoreductase [Actinomadura hibisca]|uniref:SDR family NAD(P)-dependent oxidoreductase n=1 Tax=Actinomadura hibisca TaxID=68565 RepID=UPI00082CA626|nr:SDR family NAD(P)-dependent oxidoreductase [Actinomadura hibisca]
MGSRLSRRARGVRLDGARVLVTGASSGIGRALAVELAGHGARLAVVARREEKLRELADGIGAAGCPVPLVLPADLSERGVAAGLASAVLEGLGGIDVLVNNAGVGTVEAQARLGDGAEVRAAFETNFWAPVALTAALLPSMLQAGRGAIVNVTSTVQAVPLPFCGYYGAGKAALAQATRSLRHELRGTPVEVLEVVPGSTDTALRDIDLLPWRGAPPRVLPPVRPEAVATAIVRALRRGDRRLVYPATSLLPLELPVVGRLVAALGARRIDSAAALRGVV